MSFDNKGLIEAYKEYLLVIRSLSKNSVDAYISDIEHFSNFIDKDLLAVKSNDLLKYLSQIDNNRTQNRKASSINLFYDFCLEKYDLSQKPKAVMAKIQSSLPKYLEYADIKKGLDLIDRSNIIGLRDYAMILFLYATGVRVSELIAVKKSDINDGWLKVRYAKGAKQRMVPIANNAIEAINDYLSQRDIKSDYLWLNYQGNPISRISVYKITTKYFNVSPHVFRHSFATSLILGNADLIVVSELLGHENLVTTQIYTHIGQQHLKETITNFHPLSNL